MVWCSAPATVSKPPSTGRPPHGTGAAVRRPRKQYNIVPHAVAWGQPRRSDAGGRVDGGQPVGATDRAGAGGAAG